METIAWVEKYLEEAEQMIFDGRVEEGLNVLNGLLYEEPGYGSLHNHLGWAYMYHGKDAAKAEMHFRMAIRFAASYAPPYLHMGNLLLRAGRYDEAIEYFSEGLKKPEAYRIALLEGMAQAHELKREYGNAVRAYKEAANVTVIDFEVDRILKAIKRCRRKRIVLFFSLW
jgi:tetratricopeptide (TPR) repeat protein